MLTSPSAPASASSRSRARSTDCTERRERRGSAASFTARNCPSEERKHRPGGPSYPFHMSNAADRRATLLAQAASFPASPGVYLFKDARGRVLYVGKADALREDFPRILRTRQLGDRAARYFGPYANAKGVDESLDLLQKLFPYRTCKLTIVAAE